MKKVTAQGRILKALILLGGKATTNQLMETTGMYRELLHGNCRHLRNRSLIQSTPFRIPKRKGNPQFYWEIPPKHLERALKLVLRENGDEEIDYHGITSGLGGSGERSTY